jgi:predicted ArsR family transcriptional regulator
MIMAALRKQGRRGATVHEIAALCRLDAHAVGKRMAELERAKLARVMRKRADDGMPGDEVTRASPSGRQARVWELVQEGGAL